MVYGFLLKIQNRDKYLFLHFRVQYRFLGYRRVSSWSNYYQGFWSPKCPENDWSLNWQTGLFCGSTLHGKGELERLSFGRTQRKFSQNTFIRSHWVRVVSNDKKTCLKSLSISDEILCKFGVRDTPEYQRVTSKVSRTLGFEWPDKRDKTRFGSVARGGWNIFRVVILPMLTVWALGWFE